MTFGPSSQFDTIELKGFEREGAAKKTGNLTTVHIYMYLWYLTCLFVIKPDHCSEETM